MRAPAKALEELGQDVVASTVPTGGALARPGAESRERVAYHVAVLIVLVLSVGSLWASRMQRSD